MRSRRRLAFAALVKQAHLAQHTFEGRDEVNALRSVVMPAPRWPRAAPKIKQMGTR